MSCYISIISPVYKGEASLPELVKRIKLNVETFTNSYEIILVEDCGPDKSWDVIKGICINDPRVKGLKLSRNFGQHLAIYAGLKESKGLWVVVMDCDLQDLPEEIPKLMSKALEGYDAVLGQRHIRKDHWFKKQFSKVFFSILAYLTETVQDPSVANFGVYHRKIIVNVIEFLDPFFVFPIAVQKVGFNVTKIPIKHALREIGGSSYTFSKRLKLASNIIISNSEKPIRLLVKIGIIISLSSFFYGGYILFDYFTGQIKQPGFTSIMLSIWFLSGFTIAGIGIVGLYVGKTFESSKRRPNVILNEILNV